MEALPFHCPSYPKSPEERSLTSDICIEQLLRQTLDNIAPLGALSSILGIMGLRLRWVETEHMDRTRDPLTPDLRTGWGAFQCTALTRFAFDARHLR